VRLTVTTVQSEISGWNVNTMDSPYDALNQDVSEIRLIVLAPRVFDDILMIKLRIGKLVPGTGHVEEHAELANEVLSYVWGTETSPHTVLVEGKDVSIGTNFEDALRYLRYADKVRVLWINALCI
jgi:hypothetical protein